MARRNQGVRSRARSKVTAGFAQRQAEWLSHQKALEELYRAFEVSQAQAVEIRGIASERARRIEQEGEQRAAEFSAAADEALADLRRLGESPQGIAEITGLSVHELRARLAQASGRSGETPAVGGSDRSRGPDGAR
jgi:hypothetical protein